MSVTYNGYDLEAGDVNQPETQGAVLLGRGTYGAPERDVEQIHVPGRDGDLLLDNGGFKNMQITYPCSIREYNPTVSQWLRRVLYGAPGYHRLEDSYHPDEFRLAEYRGPFEPEVYSERGNDAANVDLVFNCHPQRYLKKGAEQQQFICGPAVDNAKRFVIDLRKINTGNILKIKMLNSNTNIRLKSCKCVRTFSSGSWTDISSQVQRIAVGVGYAQHIEFTLTRTYDTGLVEFELENYGYGDRLEVSIGDKVLPTFTWATAYYGGRVQCCYDTANWFGRPIITIYGCRNENYDTLSGEYMGKSFSINLPPASGTSGNYSKYVIDCINLTVQMGDAEGITFVRDITENLTTDFPIPDYNTVIWNNSFYQTPSYVTGLDHAIMLVQTNEWRI